MEQPEKNDPTWKLLSHASKVEPSPFFARNVLRQVRNMEESPAGLIEWIRNAFRSPVFLSGAAVAVLAIAAVLWSQQSKMVPVASPSLVLKETSTFDPAAELEAVEYLGQLMAVADPGQLTDEALADLFF